MPMPVSETKFYIAVRTYRPWSWINLNFKEIFSLPIIKVKTALVVVHTFTKLLYRRSVTSDSLWPHGLQHTSFPVLTISWSLLKLMSIELVMPFNHLVLCCPLLLLPSIFPSIRGFSKELALHIRWPKYWNFSFSISPSNEYSGLISSGLTGLIFLLYKRLSRVFPNTTDQKHQFFGVQPSLWSDSHIHTWLLEKPELWLYGPLSGK